MVTVLHRRLARHLTRLREEARYSQAQVAAQLGWSGPTISRIEAGKTVPKAAALQALLNLYAPGAAQAASLIELARDARLRGWWTAFSDVFTSPLVALEDGASSIRVWEPQLIPDLLQTEAYARTVIKATHPYAPQTVHRQVQARMLRRGLLGRDHAPTLHAVIDEAVLHRHIGGPDVMEPQFVRLLTATRQPHVTLQILPFTAGTHAGLNGPFTLLGYSDPTDPAIAYTQSQWNDDYQEAPDKIDKMTTIWHDLTNAGASPDDSKSLLTELAGGTVWEEDLSDSPSARLSAGPADRQPAPRHPKESL